MLTLRGSPKRERSEIMTAFYQRIRRTLPTGSDRAAELRYDREALQYMRDWIDQKISALQ